MSYPKTNWQNLPNTTTPVVAGYLNKIENELEKLDNNIANITDEFDATKNYAQGQFCIKDNTLYKANEDITAGEWNPEQWTSTTVGDELTNIEDTYTPKVRKIADKTLDNDISASDLLSAISAVPTSRKIAGKALTADISDTDLATALKTAMGKLMYPVGSIYTSVKNTNPSSLFGGTWASIGAGKTLVGVNPSDTDFSTVKKTGGSKTRTLTITNLPEHDHLVYGIGEGVSTSETHGGHICEAKDASYNQKTSKTGSGTAFSIVQPYITVYFWERTA